MTAARPAWADQPPAAQKSMNVDLVRCPTTSTGPWLITSPRHIGCQLYWLGGRSTPHTESPPNPDGTPAPKICEGCIANKPHRWNGWLCVYDEKRLRHCILEITPNCLGPINEWLLQMGTLRGSRISLRRQNGKFNGRITADLSRSDLTDLQIAQPFNLGDELERLWQAPNRSTKPKLETPRIHEEPKPVTELRAAQRTKSYEPTDEQKEMLAAHRERKALTFAQAKRLVTPTMTRTAIKALGLDDDVCKQIGQWLRETNTPTTKKNNGKAH